MSMRHCYVKSSSEHGYILEGKKLIIAHPIEWLLATANALACDTPTIAHLNATCIFRRVLQVSCILKRLVVLMGALWEVGSRHGAFASCLWENSGNLQTMKDVSHDI